MGSRYHDTIIYSILPVVSAGSARVELDVHTVAVFWNFLAPPPAGWAHSSTGNRGSAPVTGTTVCTGHQGLHGYLIRRPLQHLKVCSHRTTPWPLTGGAFDLMTVTVTGTMGCIPIFARQLNGGASCEWAFNSLILDVRYVRCYPCKPCSYLVSYKRL